MIDLFGFEYVNLKKIIIVFYVKFYFAKKKYST